MIPKVDYSINIPMQQTKYMSYPYSVSKTNMCYFLFLKMGYSTKGYYCRLWDFKLVNVTSNFAQCWMDHFTLINLKIKLDLYQDQCLAHF